VVVPKSFDSIQLYVTTEMFKIQEQVSELSHV
jgi:hypothetical protein